MAMATERPDDARQMATISGVGELKLERYADDFLAVIAEFIQAPPRGDAAGLD